MRSMKIIDILAFALLVIGGLNWGLVGLFGFNLVGTLFGTLTPLSRIVYVLVGIAAVYEAFMWRSVQRRWECMPWPKDDRRQAV